jgi:hypothetical protein
MTANVVGSGGVPDSTYGQARRRPDEPAPAPAVAPSASGTPPPGPNDLMLVIEETGEAGGLIYTTIDRRTGAVVRRLDREALLALRQASSYAVGAVLSTRA